MSPKPFGKPVQEGLYLTRSIRLMVALWLAAIPAYVLCRSGSSRYPTLAPGPFFWPAAVGFILLYSVAIVRWLRHRPNPHGPWEHHCLAIGCGRFLLALLVAVPVGFASAGLYGPALEMGNGMFSAGAARTEHAMVVDAGPPPTLDLLYSTPPFRWKAEETRFVPANLRPGSLATLTVRRGALGAFWVEKVDYEILK